MFAATEKRAQRFIAFFVSVFLILAFIPAYASSVNGVQVVSASLSSETKTMNGMVRIYLSSLGNPSTLNLTVRGNYSVNGQFLSSGTALTVGFDSFSGSITLGYSGQTRNMGRSFSIRRHSASGANGILIAQARESQNPYPGDLSFEVVATTTGYKLYTIAHVYIEDYLYGVLPYEMGNSSSLEALKAQAVAARTYTVRMMSRRASGMYDVVDTTSDQVYRGTPSGNANCVSAVDATRGIVLMYGSEYITTYYSASNGGQTETARGGTSYAYMKVKDDPFDYANPNSTVKSKTIYADLTNPSNPAQLVSLLKTKAASKLNQMGYSASSSNTRLLTLKSITPHTPMYASPSRLYTKLDFSMTVATPAVSGVNLTVTCDIFDELESILSMGIQSSDNELWSVATGTNSFQLQARRYGHGMGMSQRGAMYMAKLGYTYDQILGFYFDGCRRVRHSFVQTVLDSSSNETSTVQPPADLDESSSYACRGIVTLPNASSVLGIRSSRSSSAALVGTAANGAMVEVLYNDGNWCQIRFGETCGYVPAGSLIISGSAPQTQMPVSSILGFATVTAGDYVNLRSSGSMNGRVLGTAPAGAVLTVFGREGAWARVQYNALSAYVSTQYISAVSASYPSGGVSSGNASAIIRTEDGVSSVNLRESPSMGAWVLTQMPSGASVTVLSDDGSWSKVIYQGYTGYVVSSFVYGTEEEPVPPVMDDLPSAPPVSAQAAIVATEFGALNMRSEPRAGSLILTTIPKGVQVQVTSRGNEWSAVYYNGLNGYVVSSYLAFEQQNHHPETTPSVDAATVVTPSGWLNLRSEPRSGSPILTTIAPYEQVKVLSYGAEWCRVTYHSITGYVMTRFLSFEDEEEPEPEQTVQATVTTSSGALNLRLEPSALSAVIGLIPQYETVTVHQRGSSWCYVTYDGISGYVMTDFLTFGPFSVPDADDSVDSAYVNTSSGALNLREYPGSAYRVLTAVPRGEEVSVLQYGDEWCQVRYNGWTGYVMTSYLSWQKPETPPRPAEPESTAAWVVTSSGSLNLREGPSAMTPVLALIPRLAQVEIIDKGNEWSFIRYQSQFGYVMTRYLSEEYPAADTEMPGTVIANGSMKLDVTLTLPPYALYAVNETGYPVDLYRMCEESGTPVATIEPWDEVEIVLIGEVWSCVAYEGRQGYCQTRLLSVIE
ncbi:MAG: SH3 domain-containing protein [bacterium]|nr:SH3 domain-containing protein [bacterium]